MEDACDWLSAIRVTRGFKRNVSSARLAQHSRVGESVFPAIVLAATNGSRHGILETSNLALDRN